MNIIKLVFSVLIMPIAALVITSCGESAGTNNSCTENCDNGNSSSSSNNNSSDIGSYAVLPSNTNKSAIQAKYDTWMNTYYTTYEQDVASGLINNTQLTAEGAEGTARIKSKYDKCSTAGECTASEGIGYGMLLASLMEDYSRFDKLLAYSKVFRINGSALMMWNIADFTNGSGGSATDADFDILAALLIAYQKSGEQKYLNDALDIGNSIYEFEIDASTKLILPAMKNEAMGKGQLYNISYFSLPAVKLLAKFDKNHDWNAVLNASLNYMKKHQDNGAGLWSDWSDANADPADPGNGSKTTITYSNDEKGDSYYAYYKETPRIPWRIAWYYHWFGDSKAKDMLNKGMSFLKTKASTPNDIKDGYRYSDGLASKIDASVVRWGSLCALSMGSTDNLDYLNQCNERILNANITTSIGDYYRNSLQLIYTMLLNGNFEI
ncbi:hypothetical protein AGMMS49938_01270 [Fibrobacterales bacterium]|nr:hypothetical protein AGMMS49938_01270 [Fibrobacterales bacterium]